MSSWGGSWGAVPVVGGGGGGGSLAAAIPSVSVNALMNRIKMRLSRRLSDYDVIIKDELTHAQQGVLEDMPLLPKFLANRDINVVVGAHSGILVGTTTRILLRPVQLYWEDVSITTGFKGIKLKRYDDIEQLQQLYAGEGTRPYGYYWDGSEIGSMEIRPYVTGDTTYYMDYLGRDPYTANQPDENDETLWTRFAGDYLMHTAGVEVAQYLRDKMALDYFAAKRQEAYQRFVRRQTAQEVADTEMVMGE